MALIESYNPQRNVQTCGPEGPAETKPYWDEFRKKCGGFQGRSTKEFTPLTYENSMEAGLHWYLDTITLAVERGLVDEAHWPTQLFATVRDLQGFLTGLSGYDDEARIQDRWYYALYRLCPDACEEDFTTAERMAQSLAEAVAALDTETVD